MKKGKQACARFYFTVYSSIRSLSLSIFTKSSISFLALASSTSYSSVTILTASSTVISLQKQSQKKEALSFSVIIPLKSALVLPTGTTMFDPAMARLANPLFIFIESSIRFIWLSKKTRNRFRKSGFVFLTFSISKTH